MSDETNNGAPVVIQTSLNDYRDAITKLHAEAIAMHGAMLETSAIMVHPMMPGTRFMLLVGTPEHWEKLIETPIERVLPNGKIRIGFFVIPER